MYALALVLVERVLMTGLIIKMLLFIANCCLKGTKSELFAKMCLHNLILVKRVLKCGPFTKMSLHNNVLI